MWKNRLTAVELSVALATRRVYSAERGALEKERGGNVRFDKHKLQAEIERMRASGEMAAALKRLRDRFVQSHSFDASDDDAVTAKDLERVAGELRLRERR
jgi:hypothetical protein